MRHTRAEVVERTVREFEALDALVARLGPGDWARPVPRPEGRDPWTIKDALAHVVYWKSHTARAMRGEQRLPELRGLDVPRINRWVYQQWRDRPAAEVVAWHRAVHEDVMRTLAGKPDDWFGRREHHPEWPADLGSHSASHRRKDIETVLG
jgi:Mycothiol maleylpyruvate isomerase N-terminal domain